MEIFQRRCSCEELARDSRPFHHRLFHKLTPPELEYYAGNYRGAPYPCLIDRRVTVDNRRFGAPPYRVSDLIDALHKKTIRILMALDKVHARPGQDQRLVLAHTVQVVSELVFEFWLIHPYLNGNGHMGRLLLAAFFVRHGYLPHGFSIEPRPNEPGYAQAILDYRDNKKESFHNYVLNCLAPPKKSKIRDLC